MLPLLIPIVTQLAESGLNLLSSAVQAKGKDVIEKTLGVDLDKEMTTEDGKLKLKKMEFDHEEFLVSAAQAKAEQALKQYAAENENTSGARDMNEKIQESANASTLAKNAAYIIDFFVILAPFLMATMVLYHAVPEGNKELFYTAFGAMLGLCTTIINFHRGSSAHALSTQTAVVTK